ncbi:MAG: Hsp20/alpha crystallin family protein [Candidatus Bathyarchaeota archaeon]|nr:Hsp20/alpha crystallin family protein [Candidatus Bathyarchaeota archaeon]
MSEEKKKKYYYYAGKEKKATEIKKRNQEEIAPYWFGDIRDFDRMIDSFEREFEDFWGRPIMAGPRWWRHRFPMMPWGPARMPSVDLEDQGKEYRLTVDLPGFKKEDVDIEVTEDTVTVNAKKAQTEEEKKKNYIRRERSAQTYYRTIQLPENIRSDEAKANLNNGILEITLPKKEPKATKKIAIT